jgi:cell division protein ZapA (FtsZ GTPase activity inhibitor)
MNKLLFPIKNLKQQSGQGVMEYIILTGLIGMLCLFSVKNFGEKIKSKIEQSTKRLNQTVKIR